MQICSINDRELTDIERMIFKFLWNKKWVGSAAPDRIKRDILKQSYSAGGLQVPDDKILDKALKIKQFIRSMSTSHPIHLVQKYQLERIGYFEFYKCEYAKICKVDSIVKTYQESCNKFTDRFRVPCGQLPLPELNTIQDSINVIASTDVLEYLMRKNYPLVINMFGRLSRLGIVTYYQLLNEFRFPRTDDLGILARNTLQFFPDSWREAVLGGDNINPDITYEFVFPAQQFKLCNSKTVSVKEIRKTLNESIKVTPHSYLNNQKFQLDLVPCHNPFILLRNAFHPPRDRFFKYRILQGDIFNKERLFKFKLSDTPFCDYCQNIGNIETIKHLMWDCPRSRFVWNRVNDIILRAYNINYINYNSIILGSSKPILVAEKLILVCLKLILSKDRSNEITIESITSGIKIQYILEKNRMRNNLSDFKKQWEKIVEALALDRG